MPPILTKKKQLISCILYASQSRSIMGVRRIRLLVECGYSSLFFLNFSTLIKFLLYYLFISIQFYFFHHSTHLMTHSALDLIICNRDVLIHRFFSSSYICTYVCKYGMAVEALKPIWHT